MFSPIRLIAKGATVRAGEEYFGQILAFGALYVTAKVGGKVRDYFLEPIKVDPEVIDHVEDNSDAQSEE